MGALTIAVRESLARARAGEPLQPEDAYPLARAEGADLWALLDVASALRDHYKGRVVTYSRKVFIPLTNLCRDTCGYCIFAKRLGEPEARTMTPEEVLDVARAGERQGCKEALFSLGDKPELRYPSYRRWLHAQGYATTLAYLRAMCQRVFEETGLLPHANPGQMSEADIAMLRPYNLSMGIMLESVSLRLLRPGMPHHRCPDKVPRRRLETIAAAGRQHVAFTTGILIGIGETPEERVDSLCAIRALHATGQHIQEVIIQNFRAKPGTPMAEHPEPTLAEMLRTIAVARLLMPQMNIQAPPNLAPREYRWYLNAGLNDWGGISPVTCDWINPEAPWPKVAELDDVCRAEGFTLRERLALYPEYVREGERWIPPALRAPVAALVDETGLVRRTVEGEPLGLGQAVRHEGGAR